MTEEEFDYENALLDVELAKLRVQISKIEMEQGYRKLKAELEKDYELLKNKFAEAQVELKKDELHARFYKSELDKGPYREEDDGKDTR